MSRQSSCMTRRAKPNSAPPLGRPRAQMRPPIARTSRAQTNRPIPAPAVAFAGAFALLLAIDRLLTVDELRRAVESGAIDTVLFVWMLVALVRRGPWAMKRIS